MDRILGDRTLRMRDRLLSAKLGNLDRQNERLRNESAGYCELDFMLCWKPSVWPTS